MALSCCAPNISLLHAKTTMHSKPRVAGPSRADTSERYQSLFASVFAQTLTGTVQRTALADLITITKQVEAAEASRDKSEASTAICTQARNTQQQATVDTATTPVYTAPGPNHCCAAPRHHAIIISARAAAEQTPQPPQSAPCKAAQHGTTQIQCCWWCLLFIRSCNTHMRSCQQHAVRVFNRLLALLTQCLYDTHALLTHCQ
jgi:hypothetical protein